MTKPDITQEELINLLAKIAISNEKNHRTKMERAGMTKTLLGNSIFQLKLDGNVWSVGLANCNSKESPCGFGDTISAAFRCLADAISLQCLDQDASGRAPPPELKVTGAEVFKYLADVAKSFKSESVSVEYFSDLTDSSVEVTVTKLIVGVKDEAQSSWSRPLEFTAIVDADKETDPIAAALAEIKADLDQIGTLEFESETPAAKPDNRSIHAVISTIISMVPDSFSRRDNLVLALQNIENDAFDNPKTIDNAWLCLKIELDRFFKGVTKAPWMNTVWQIVHGHNRIEPMSARRPIQDVISAVMKSVPSTYPERNALFQELKKLQNDAGFRAPEAIQECWQWLSDILHRHFRGSVDQPWVQTIARIVSAELDYRDFLPAAGPQT